MSLKRAGNFPTASKVWVVLIMIVVFSLTMLSGSQSLADPFMSYPGSRARAMGGAFTGIADDVSAVWYNPAGVSGEEHGLTLEWSQAIIRDKERGGLSSGSNAWFMGGQFSLDEFGIGLFYYPPYTVKYWAPKPQDNRSAWGKVNEIIQTISLPLAVSTFDGSLKLGGSLEWVHIGIDDSRIFSGADGYPREYKLSKKGATGFSGSIGTLFTFFGNEPWPYELRFGGTYRLRSATDIGSAAVHSDSDEAVSRLFFDKPKSYDLGISVTKDFPSIGSLLIVATQYGSTDWGGAAKGGPKCEYGKLSIGLEFAIIRETAILKRTSFRIGHYSSHPSANSTPYTWRPDVTGITYGIGIMVGDNFDSLHVDISQEQKTMENDGFSDTAALTSLAVTWSY